jgi:hypothetical protein
MLAALHLAGGETVAFEGRNTRVLLIGIGIAAIAVTIIGWWLASRPSEVDRTMAELRATPLIGLTMSEDPAIEIRLRKALEEDIRAPISGGPSRIYVQVLDLRTTRILSALMSADDASATAVVAARLELVRRLQQTDLPACREFYIQGIQRVDRLDGESQRLFRNLLATMEAAYRNGRAPGAVPRGAVDFESLLKDAGFTQADFAIFNDHTKFSDAEICALGIRIDTAPDRLPADKRVQLSRYILLK